MTQTGDPLENPVAERINKTIKEEFTDDRQINFPTIAMAKESIKGFIKFYNEQRPHRSLNWLTPSQAYCKTGVLQRVWKKYINKKCEWGDLVEA